MTVLVLAMSWLITATGLAWVEEPPAPRVDRLDVRPAVPEGCAGFEVLPTAEP